MIPWTPTVTLCAMGLRLNFGIGPLRASIPLTGSRRATHPRAPRQAPPPRPNYVVPDWRRDLVIGLSVAIGTVIIVIGTVLAIVGIA